jgi:hypothetical protein
MEPTIAMTSALLPREPSSYRTVPLMATMRFTTAPTSPQPQAPTWHTQVGHSLPSRRQRTTEPRSFRVLPNRTPGPSSGRFPHTA